MQKTVTIPLDEYKKLKHTAELLEDIIEEEHLTEEELDKIKHAEGSGKISKEDFYSRHPTLKE